MSHPAASGCKVRALEEATAGLWPLPSPAHLPSLFCPADLVWTEWFNHEQVWPTKGREKTLDPGKICSRPIEIQVLQTHSEHKGLRGRGKLASSEHLRDQLRDQPGNQLRDQLRDQLENQLGDKLKD